MSADLLKRLFHSVFTKLLVIIISTGLAITLALGAGFAFTRFHGVSLLDRNLLLYGELLKQDLGTPPDAGRAEQIAKQTGMSIAFNHPENAWQTTGFPSALFLKWNRFNQWSRKIQTGRLAGYSFIHIPHAKGELIFVSPLWKNKNKTLWQVFLVMASVLLAVLAAAYYFIRQTLDPLRDLKTGVERLGNGQLEYRISCTGHDEFFELSRAFNNMAQRISFLLKNKERLLLDVSHELRTPLTRLKIQTEMIGDDDTRKSLKSDLKEMEIMVTAILEQARLRNAANALHIRPTDMATLVKEVACKFNNRLPGVSTGPLEPVTASVDPDKMRTVLRNLIDNALKNTPENGKPVVVTMTRDDKRLDIIVEDKGIGIAHTALPHLFEPFFRTDASRSRKTGGFGLGLSLCKAVIDAHNGKININSTPGLGTRITVGVPV